MITIIVLWLMFFLSGVITYGFKKVITVHKNIIGMLTQWIMFFPAWHFKDKKNNIFKWWLDDSRFSYISESGYSKEYEIYLKGKNETIKRETIFKAYIWHLKKRILKK